MDYTTINGEYLKKHPTWHNEHSPFKAKDIKTILSKNNIVPQSVIEIGCGAGGILASLQTHYPDAIFNGYDISSDAIRIAKQLENDNLHFHLGDFLSDDITQHTKCNTVLIAADVFEHIEDYYGFLRKIRSKAEFKVFRIPLDMHLRMVVLNKFETIYNADGHLHYFCPDTALLTLKNCGYEIVDFFYNDNTAMMRKISKVSISSSLAIIPRFFTAAVFGKNFCQRVLGGYSLSVLTK
jgi:SAM-dependent methyltransferase